MVESDETRWHGSKPWTWSETRRHVWPSIVEARDEPTVSPDKRDDALWKDSRGEDEFDLYERLAWYTEYFSSSFDTCLSTYLYTSPLSTSRENLKMFQFPWIYIRDNEGFKSKKYFELDETRFKKDQEFQHPESLSLFLSILLPDKSTSVIKNRIQYWNFTPSKIKGGERRSLKNHEPPLFYRKRYAYSRARKCEEIPSRGVSVDDPVDTWATEGNARKKSARRQVESRCVSLFLSLSPVYAAI